MIGEGFREWFEAPSYEEGVGVDGEPAGSACEKPPYVKEGRVVVKKII